METETISKLDRIKNQYPHLSEQEIMDLLGRSKFDNIRNQYPHLSDDQIQTLIDNADELKKVKAAAQGMTVRYIPVSMANIEQIVSGEYTERIMEFLAKNFSFLDFSRFTQDLSNVIDEFISRAKQHPEFEAAVAKLSAEFLAEKAKIEAEVNKTKKPAARPRASRAKGGNAGAAGSKSKKNK